jgi:hypothetical protein
MAQRRPGSVTAAAVLSIIYGSLFTLCGLCGMVSLVAQGAIGKNFMGGGDPMQEKLQKDLEAALRNDVPAYQAFNAASTIISLAEAIALLCAGIGLVSMQSWARRLALIVCLITIATTILNAVYQTVFVIPALNKVFQEELPRLLQQQNAGAQAAEVLQLLRTMMTLIAVGMAILYFVLIVYLLIIVLLLSRQHVRAAFAAAAAGFPGEPYDSENPPGAYEDDPGWGQDPKDDWRYREK